MLRTDIDFTRYDYDILEITNTRNKDLFVKDARRYFQDDFFIPDGPDLFHYDISEQDMLDPEVTWKYFGGDMHEISWDYLFLEYMRLSTYHPYGKYPDINDVIKSIYTEKIWNGPMLLLRDQVFELLIKNAHKFEQRRSQAIDFKNRGVSHSLQIKDNAREKNFKVCYSEDFRIPNHSSVVVQVPTFAGAKITSDFLYHDGGDQTISIKMVNTLTDPTQYRFNMITKESRNCLFSLNDRCRT